MDDVRPSWVLFKRDRFKPDCVVREIIESLIVISRSLQQLRELTNSLCRSATSRLRRRPFYCPIESLEPRCLLAADLVPLSIATPTVIEPGGKVTLTLTLENQGVSDARRVPVAIRLSADGTLSPSDTVIKSIKVRGLVAGDTQSITTDVKIPKSITAGRWYVAVELDPANRVPESNDANNSRVSDTTLLIGQPELTGRARSQSKSRPVSLILASDEDAIIDPSRTTWVVIHGRNQSASSANMVTLAMTIDDYQAGDQVLLLDWSKAAKSPGFGGQGENFIQPVAVWAAAALSEYGLTGQSINLVGYSWGADVAAEIAERLPEVNSLLAIDPARDYPGGTYNPEEPGEVDLQALTPNSWAFFAPADLTFGSEITAETATNGVLILGSDHFGIVSIITQLLALPADHPLAQNFSLARLLDPQFVPEWQDNAYQIDGVLDPENGPFEAVVMAATGGQSAINLTYFTGQDELTVSI